MDPDHKKAAGGGGIAVVETAFQCFLFSILFVYFLLPGSLLSLRLVRFLVLYKPPSSLGLHSPPFPFRACALVSAFDAAKHFCTLSETGEEKMERKNDELYSFLSSLELMQYYESFKREGFDRLEAVSTSLCRQLLPHAFCALIHMTGFDSSGMQMLYSAPLHSSLPLSAMRDVSIVDSRHSGVRL
ncbi:hypothetical protein GQ54DRAFT_207472 [Martensiomyces pterosporus]|nr:hypothetical protein GQ54DRAFT_207472 [Martensiomyces pterosporus]